ncbi:hypothetical protein MGI_04378 [Candida albicans P75016]|nr:hypothetical protein MGM_04423 [Candida albicans P75063]KHC64898.1 hypothetical protein MGI_04378 [Candida albicans P75016]
MSYLSSAFKGLVAGSIITPIVTKVFIVPLYFDSQIHKEIHYIQQEMEYVGWHIRHLEEEKGFQEEELYQPATYYGPVP